MSKTLFEDPHTISEGCVLKIPSFFSYFCRSEQYEHLNVRISGGQSALEGARMQRALLYGKIPENQADVKHSLEYSQSIS